MTCFFSPSWDAGDTQHGPIDSSNPHFDFYMERTYREVVSVFGTDVAPDSRDAVLSNNASSPSFIR